MNASPDRECERRIRTSLGASKRDAYSHLPDVTTAPINDNLVLAYLGQHVLGTPRLYWGDPLCLDATHPGTFKGGLHSYTSGYTSTPALGCGRCTILQYGPNLLSTKSCETVQPSASGAGVTYRRTRPRVNWSARSSAMHMQRWAVRRALVSPHSRVRLRLNLQHAARFPAPSHGSSHTPSPSSAGPAPPPSPRPQATPPGR